MGGDRQTSPGEAAAARTAERYLPTQREEYDISSLPLNEPSVTQLRSLPPLHRAIFDRMLVCQASQHGLVIATADDAVRAYPVAVL